MYIRYRETPTSYTKDQYIKLGIDELRHSGNELIFNGEVTMALGLTTYIIYELFDFVDGDKRMITTNMTDECRDFIIENDVRVAV